MTPDLPVPDDARALVRELFEAEGGSISEFAYVQQIAGPVVGAVLRELTTRRAFRDVQGELQALADAYDPGPRPATVSR